MQRWGDVSNILKPGLGLVIQMVLHGEWQCTSRRSLQVEADKVCCQVRTAPTSPLFVDSCACQLQRLGGHVLPGFEPRRAIVMHKVARHVAKCISRRQCRGLGLLARSDLAQRRPACKAHLESSLPTQVGFEGRQKQAAPRRPHQPETCIPSPSTWRATEGLSWRLPCSLSPSFVWWPFRSGPTPWHSYSSAFSLKITCHCWGWCVSPLSCPSGLQLYMDNRSLTESQVVYLVYATMGMVGVHYGLGRQLKYVEPVERPIAMKFAFVAALVYIVLSYLCKVIVGLFLVRICSGTFGWHLLPPVTAPVGTNPRD